MDWSVSVLWLPVMRAVVGIIIIVVMTNKLVRILKGRGGSREAFVDNLFLVAWTLVLVVLGGFYYLIFWVWLR
jgi:hypothetical protein